MSELILHAPVEKKLLTKGVYVLLGIIAVAGVVTLYRLIFGLESTTNLDNQYPWGIWIAIDVAGGVALAAGGFTTSALAHIFQRHRYEAVVRPALLTALLGYTFVGLALMVDLGRYYNIWHPIVPTMWQGNSVLFEVGMCVMAYSTILYCEFFPIVCEKFLGKVNLPGPLAMLNSLSEKLLQTASKFFRKTMLLFFCAGVVLSCMHQSALGSLLLIAPSKMHPLWYTPILPLLFLLSAISVGYPMVIFESIIASKIFKRKPEMKILAPLSRFVVFFIGVYWAVKIADLSVRGAFPYLIENSLESFAFIVEFLVGGLIPFVILMKIKNRENPKMLFTAATLIVLAVLINRVNVFLIAYKPPYADYRYIPSVGEIVVTAGVIATIALVYRVVVTIFPILPKEEEA